MTKYGTQTDTIRRMTTADEATDPKLVSCPNCTVRVVPRGISSTRKSAAGDKDKHCPNCGHVFGRNSLLDRRVRFITVTGAAGATAITVDNATLQLSAAILPDYADNQKVTWSLVAGTAVGTTISASGLVTPGAGAPANGTVTAVATAQDGSGVIGSLLITMSNQT